MDEEPSRPDRSRALGRRAVPPPAVHLAPAAGRGYLPGLREISTTRFVARVAFTSAVAWALELAWTVRLVPRGPGALAIALLGPNVALALTGIALATLGARTIDRGWGVTAWWTTARRGPAGALAADLVLCAALGVAGAEVLVAAVGAAYEVIDGSVRTAAFRGPLVGVAALAVAIVLVALGPGLGGPIRTRVARARSGAQWAVAGAGVLLGLGGAAAVFVVIRPTLAELDPPVVLGLAAPLVALLVGWLAGPVVTRRLSGRGWAIVCLLLCASLFASAGVMARRRVLGAAVASLSLQSRRFAVLASRASARRPTAPGPAARLFLPEPVRPARPRARHLVLVTIDALRADRAFPPEGSALERRRLMPNLRALAARGTRFDAAFCTVPGSLRAVPSILTGRYSNGLPWRRPSQVMLDPRRSETLAELLAAEGFDTRFVPHTRYVMNQGTTQGFARVVDPVLLPEADRRRKKPRDVAMVAATLDELRRRPVGDRRLFLWSHFIDPHAPYWDHGRFGDDEEDRYDAEAAASDRALGMLRQGLDDLGLLEDAVVVVTADHGEEFGEHGTRRHSRSLWNEALRVPLVVSAPGSPPRRIADPVSHVDLVPTLLQLLGLPVPRELDGRSLAGTVTDGARPPQRTIVLVSYPMYDRVPAEYAAVRGSRKLITDREGVATGLYDFRTDPAERDNLLDEAPASLVRALEADVSRYRARGLGEARR